MSKAKHAANGLDSMIQEVMGPAQASQEQAMRAWADACGVYARYFTALSDAKGLEAVMTANAELITNGFDTIARSSFAAQKTNGLDRAADHAEAPIPLPE